MLNPVGPYRSTIVLTYLVGRDQLLRLEHRASAARASVLAGHGLCRHVVGHEFGPVKNNIDSGLDIFLYSFFTYMLSACFPKKPSRLDTRRVVGKNFLVYL